MLLQGRLGRLQQQLLRVGHCLFEDSWSPWWCVQRARSTAGNTAAMAGARECQLVWNAAVHEQYSRFSARFVRAPRASGTAFQKLQSPPRRPTPRHPEFVIAAAPGRPTLLSSRYRPFLVPEGRGLQARRAKCRTSREAA